MTKPQKATATAAKKDGLTIGILRRVPGVVTETSMHISEYAFQGITYWPKFPENSVQIRTYGAQVYPIIFSAGEMSKQFDLIDNPVHAMQWEFLKKMKERQVGVFNVAYPLVEIYEPEKEAREQLSSYDMKDQATELYKKLESPADRRDFACLFGIQDADDNKTALNLRQLIDSTPNEFIAAWNDPNKDTTIIAHRAMAAGVINRDAMGMYQFGANKMGVEIADVLRWLAENPDQMPVLRNEVQNRMR